MTASDHSRRFDAPPAASDLPNQRTSQDPPDWSVSRQEETSHQGYAYARQVKSR
jgi:hypothetical protein